MQGATVPSDSLGDVAAAVLPIDDAAGVGDAGESAEPAQETDRLEELENHEVLLPELTVRLWDGAERWNSTELSEDRGDNSAAAAEAFLTDEDFWLAAAD